ncbi:MAG: hypothetical protein ACI4UE_03735 [Candidatus Scatovivens sp.]
MENRDKYEIEDFDGEEYYDYTDEYTDEEFWKEYEDELAQCRYNEAEEAPTLKDIAQDIFEDGVEKAKESPVGKRVLEIIQLYKNHKVLQEEINQRNLEWEENDLTPEQIKELEELEEIKNQNIEQIGKTTIKAGVAAIGMGVVGIGKLIKGAVTLAGHVKRKIDGISIKDIAKKVDDKILQMQMNKAIDKSEKKKEKQERKEEIKNNVKEKINDIKESIETSKEFTKATIQVGIENRKNKYQQAKNRFEKRKNDTIIGALRGGKKVAEVLLKRIEGAILSKQEKNSLRQEKVNGEMDKNTEDKNTDEIEM